MTSEQKFERVEERTIDSGKGLSEVRVGTDTGHGDPALNFTPTNAAIVRAPGVGPVAGEAQYQSGVRIERGDVSRDVSQEQFKSTAYTHTEVRFALR